MNTTLSLERRWSGDSGIISASSSRICASKGEFSEPVASSTRSVPPSFKNFRSLLLSSSAKGVKASSPAR